LAPFNVTINSKLSHPVRQKRALLVDYEDNNQAAFEGEALKLLEYFWLRMLQQDPDHSRKPSSAVRASGNDPTADAQVARGMTSRGCGVSH
jgi:hypothetical protein